MEFEIEIEIQINMKYKDTVTAKVPTFVNQLRLKEKKLKGKRFVDIDLNNGSFYDLIGPMTPDDILGAEV